MHANEKAIAIDQFCKTRSKRSVEVYKAKNLDPPPRPPHRHDRHP